MNRLSAALAITAFLGAGFAASASATTIVVQPPQLGDTGAFISSDFIVPQQAGDIFSLGQEVDDNNLVTVRWYGLYATSSFGTVAPLTADDFTASFYAIDSGTGVIDVAPTASVTGADLPVQRKLPPFDTSFGFDIFEYVSSFSIGAGVVLPAGDYLLSIVNDSTAAGRDVQWFWRSNATGVGTDPNAKNRPGQVADANGWTTITGQGGVRLAYTLSVNGIPTPATANLLLLGFGLIGAMRKKSPRNT